jgi:hypothetical protein
MIEVPRYLKYYFVLFDELEDNGLMLSIGIEKEHKK